MAAKHRSTSPSLDGVVFQVDVAAHRQPRTPAFTPPGATTGLVPGARGPVS